MESISWSHYPLVANHDHAHRWLQFTANIGRAPNTIEAYRHALEDHLQFCAVEFKGPIENIVERMFQRRQEAA